MAGWRRLYKREWKPAKERVEYVKQKVESWHPKLRVKIGFMADSTQQILAGMPEGHEMGEPDLKVLLKKKHIANIEVTGSWINIRDGTLWVRPDKIKWVKEHLIPKTWIWFVYKDKEFVMTAVDVDQYPIEEINIKGVIERYHTIPQVGTLPIDSLKEFLLSSCRKPRHSGW